VRGSSLFSWLFSALCASCASIHFPTPTMAIPAPGGPHKVGFSETTLAVPGRVMVAQGKEMERVLTLDVWYPAQRISGHQPVPYSDQKLNAALSKQFHLPSFMMSETESYAFGDAPVLEGNHPLVVFNHGYGSFTRQNFANLQDLASRGMVVVSVGHPGDSLLCRDGAGNAIPLDLESSVYKEVLKAQEDPKPLADAILASLDAQRAATTHAAYRDASIAFARNGQNGPMGRQAATWIQDTRDVLAALTAGMAHPVLSHVDASNVLLMGHSLGGFVALTLAADPPAGVKGAINLDGPWMLYDDATDPTIKVPVLNLVSTDNMLEGRNLKLAGTLQPLFKHASAGAYVLELEGTAHMNFADMNFVRVTRLAGVLGPVDGLTMHEVMTESMAEFARRAQTGIPVTLEMALLAPRKGLVVHTIPATAPGGS